ncbi:MAG: hypothetical protein A2Z25_01725 [Planctomycetes bacterium RBG_16_55_9]|nr:MAG: hypothetical protein A2Z25_01725 [Planctomycetes bacterium RBG_16_55_9]
MDQTFSIQQMISIPGKNRESREMPGARYGECRPFRHFPLFSVAAIVVILFVAGLGLRHLLWDIIVSEAEHDAIHVSRAARDCEIRKYIERHPGENDRVLDIPPSELPLVDDEMQVFAELFDIIKIKIYNVERRIIYSTDPKLIGRSDPHNTFLQTALSGTPVSKYQPSSQVWDFADEAPVKVEIVETYVPIYGRDGRIIGSFEVYKNISEDLAVMHVILVRSWSVLAVTVLGVFTALMFVIHRSVQTIKVTTRNLAATNEQLQQEVEDRRSLEKELLSVIERERQRIGQELHDSIGQQLAGITFIAEALRGKLRHKSLTGEMPFAERISACVSQVAQQTRNLSKGLHPIDLDKNGLSPALEELAANTEQLFDVSCTLESEGTVVTKDPSVQIHLYRIAQEAITNAIKHGKARNVRIRLLARNPEGLRDSELSVENDGLAFPEKKAHGRGMGLRIMRYRAETINGSLDIRKGGHGGTLVTCTFPSEEGP